MKAVELSIEASGKEGAQGGENRTGQYPVFPGATDATRGDLELWAAVLLQAIEDYHRKGAGFELAVNGFRLRGWYYDREIRRDKRRAEAWFKSKCEDVGSFLWICDILKLDPGRVWARTRERNFVLTR